MQVIHTMVPNNLLEFLANSVFIGTWVIGGLFLVWLANRHHPKH